MGAPDVVIINWVRLQVELSLDIILVYEGIPEKTRWNHFRNINPLSMGVYMIIEYCQKAIENAEYRKLNDGTWFTEIPGFKGVWANGASVEECRKELIEVLEEWLILKLRDNDPIPEIRGLKIEFREVAAI